MFVRIIKKALLNLRLLLIKSKEKNLKIGANFKFDRKTTLDIRGNKLTIGDNVYLRSNVKGYHAGMPFPTTVLIDNPGARCFIGDNSRINGAYIHAQKSIYIGENCVIASGVNIIDSNGHELYSLNRTKGRDEPKDIVIKNNVWIGLNAVILKGSIIGDNSVIAANSVVKGEFPGNVLIQGNPAIIIKTLDNL